MKPTIRDIANELNVSISTVSMALNDKPGVSAERKKQILQKAQEIGYYASNSKASGASVNIGLVFYKNIDGRTELPFLLCILGSLSTELRKRGYNLVTISIDQRNDHTFNIKTVKQANCVALVYLASRFTQQDQYLLNSFNLPSVMVDCVFFRSSIDTIVVNQSIAVSIAIDYLIKAGHRNIGYFRRSNPNSILSLRFNAYKQCMSDLGIGVKENSVFALNYNNNILGKGADLFSEYRRDSNLPTAFLADNDSVALCAMQLAQSLGMNVPDDISIVGFDNRNFCSILQPQLTSVGFSVDYYGKAIADVLLRRMETNEQPVIPSYTEIGCQLFERSSVKFIN